MTIALLACKHCDAGTNAKPEVARAAGWRTYEGPSQTGKHLSDVVCPSCAGEVPEEQLLRAKSWDVTCDVCDWSYADGFDDPSEFEPLLTRQEAKEVARDHECEPLLRLKPPHGEWSEAKEGWAL